MKTINKVIILFALGAVLVSCGGKEDGKTAGDTVPKVEAAKIGELKIAYYDSDSLKMHFDYYREQDSIVTKKQLSFQKEIEKRSKDYQDFIVRKDGEARSGLLSQNEMAQVQQKMQQMEAELMRYQQERGAQLENETMKKLEEISNKISVLGKQFSEENKIDILLIHGKGGQMNYITPKMDVTKEFIEYLNQRQEEIEKDLK
jgi:Skp family chaperone for outer membrane proteins